MINIIRKIVDNFFKKRKKKKIEQELKRLMARENLDSF
jgi:hypothetical protein